MSNKLKLVHPLLRAGSFAVLLGALCSACGGGAAPAAPLVPVPPTVAEPVPATPTIKLLAGNIGGSGNIDGVGTAARLQAPEAMALDQAGNLYVADTGNHTVRRVSPSGEVSTLAGLAGIAGDADGTGAAARLNGPTGLVVDRAGTVFVFERAGKMRSISQGGVVKTLLQRYSGFPRNSLTIDRAGNIYLPVIHAIHKITPDGVESTFAGRDPYKPSFGPIIEGGGYADGKGTDALFYSPSGIATDDADNVYVADGTRTIRKITPNGEVSTVAGLAWTEGSTDGVGAAARFTSMRALAIDRLGHVLVLDQGLVRKLEPSGSVTTLAGSASVTSAVDGSGTQARFSTPKAIAAFDASAAYILDDNNTIRKLSGSTASTFVGAVRQAGSVDAVGADARFNQPVGLAIDRAGNVLVADRFAFAIRKITPSGVVTTFSGMLGKEGSNDGLATASRFAFATGVAVDATGNTYVADTYNSTIRKISADGTVSTLAGLAGAYGTADGTGSAARLSSPASITAAPDALYVVDAGSQTIRRVSYSGDVTTIAGSAGNTGAVDGVGAAARFLDAFGIVADGNGNLYVGDRNNHVIRKITSNGTVTTVAGRTGECGAVDGAAATARFCQPGSMAIDRAGNLYVGDTGNQLIRRITPAGMVSTVVGRPGAVGTSTGPLPGSLSGSWFVPIGLAIDANDVLYYTSSDAVLSVKL